MFRSLTVYPNILNSSLDRIDRVPLPVGAVNDADDRSPESPLVRLSRDVTDPAATCAGVVDPLASGPAIAPGERSFVNDRHTFRGPFPHTSALQPDAASSKASLESTLRMIEPDLRAWLSGIRKRLSSEMTKRIFVIGYAQGNPTLGFAISERATECLIKSGLDPRLISVSRDDQAETGRDVWLRVIEIPNEVGMEARRRDYA
jgi:hypothetical protein